MSENYFDVVPGTQLQGKEASILNNGLIWVPIGNQVHDEVQQLLCSQRRSAELLFLLGLNSKKNITLSHRLYLYEYIVLSMKV